jgi:energy-converting hydrogenase Eha subunit C
MSHTRSASRGIGLDRVQGMSWMTLYAIVAVICGSCALLLVRWPRTVKALLAFALVMQFVFVRWTAVN